MPRKVFTMKAATTGADAAAHGLGKPAAADLGGTAQPGSSDGQGRASATGPDVTAAAWAGLCRAWQAGQGADRGRRMDAVALQALVEAAGGADHIAAYCEDVAAGSEGAHGQGQASPPNVSAPSTSVSPPSSGQHRPWRARAGRIPDHHRLTCPVPATWPVGPFITTYGAFLHILTQASRP